MLREYIQGLKKGDWIISSNIIGIYIGRNENGKSIIATCRNEERKMIKEYIEVDKPLKVNPDDFDTPKYLLTFAIKHPLWREK